MMNYFDFYRYISDVIRTDSAEIKSSIETKQPFINIDDMGNRWQIDFFNAKGDKRAHTLNEIDTVVVSRVDSSTQQLDSMRLLPYDCGVLKTRLKELCNFDGLSHPLKTPPSFNPSLIQNRNYAREEATDLRTLIQQVHHITLPSDDEMLAEIESRRQSGDPTLEAIGNTSNITALYAAYLYLLGHHLIVLADQGKTAVEYPCTIGLPNITVYQEGDQFYSVQSSIDAKAAASLTFSAIIDYPIDITYPRETTLYYVVSLYGPRKICFGETFHPFDLKRNLSCSRGNTLLFSTLEEARAANYGMYQSEANTTNSNMYNPLAPSYIIYVLQGVPKNIFEAVVEETPEKIEAYLRGCHYPELHEGKWRWVSQDFPGEAVLHNELDRTDYCNFYELLGCFEEYSYFKKPYYVDTNRLSNNYMIITKTGEDMLSIRCVDARVNPPIPSSEKAHFLALTLKKHLGIETEVGYEGELIITKSEDIDRLFKQKRQARVSQQAAPSFFGLPSQSASSSRDTSIMAEVKKI